SFSRKALADLEPIDQSALFAPFATASSCCCRRLAQVVAKPSSSLALDLRWFPTDEICSAAVGANDCTSANQMKEAAKMVTHNWPLLAKLLSIIAHRRLSHVYRAAFCLDGTQDNPVVVIFGNDEYSSNDRAHHDVESFREALTETGNDELGFS